jgi:hypothetical protein
MHCFERELSSLVHVLLQGALAKTRPVLNQILETEFDILF